MLGTILAVVLILMTIGVLPHWSHSRSWGYVPGGLLGMALIVVLVLTFAGRL